MTNSHRYQAEVLQDRYGLRVAARLSLGAEALPRDIAERLKTARIQALAKRKVSPRPTASRWWYASGDLAVLGGGDDKFNWWSGVASALPLLVLAIGLVAINGIQNERAASELAAVDAALLVDDLPPSAYADPGFVRFIQMDKNQAR
jgi:hypothetical protein